MMRAQVLIAVAWLMAWRPDCALAQRQPEIADQERWLGESGPSLATVKHHALDLGNDNAQTRERAIAYLSTLPEQALPAIQSRVQELAASNLDSGAVFKVLEKLLQAAASHGSLDAPAPLGTGASTVLAHPRDADTCLLVETVLLLQSLESMKVTQAGLQMAAFFQIAEGALGNELRRARTRAGQWLLPALIALRSHERKDVKRWAQAGVRALGAEDAKLATNLDNAQRVAEVVLAYSDPLDYEAMPTLVRLTADSRVQVREAARVAVARFGQNAVWQLRELYEELTSTRAEAGWDASRTARELYVVIDRESRNRADQALAAGLQAKQNDDLNAMQESFDVAVSAMPEHPKQLLMARGYAEAGAKALLQRQYAQAERAYRTAVHLAAKNPEAARYRTELAFVRAEQALAEGLADRSAYEEVLAHDPGHAGARAALDRISGRQAARLRERKRLAAGAAGILLVAAAVWLAWHRMREAATEAAA